MDLRGPAFLVITACMSIYAEAVRKFSSDFIFGAATSSYQVEGAWNEDGKGWSTWDHLVHTYPGDIADGTTGDTAANSYHLYKRDVEMLKELGVKAYRFSISWPRILPNGRPDHVNPKGVAHYNAFINELLANGIEPFVTMYHWELPLSLQEEGGLLNDSFQDWFGDYARILFREFGDRVKFWMTINEPYIYCYYGFELGLLPPRVRSNGTGFYDCGRNILLAHARAFRIYDEGFRAAHGGQVGVLLNADWPIPSTDSDDDAEAAKDILAFLFGQYMDPIYTPQGNYPQTVIDKISKASSQQGLNTSRLRPFTEEQIAYIRRTSDFLALNHYSTDMVYRNASVLGLHDIPSVYNDIFVGTYKDPAWPLAQSYWLAEYAPGLYNLLIHIKENYNNPVVYITENGFSTTTGLLDDGRIRYLRNYLSAIHQAIEEGANVRGYFPWSLMDTFEWIFGYTVRFGLYEVDIEDPNRKRTPRKSALVYKEIIRSKTIDYEYDPDPFAAQYSYSYTASILAVVMVGLFQLVKYDVYYCS